MLDRPRNPEIIAQPPSALRVIALAVGIEIEEARTIVRALVKAGFVVAPMEPTNSMFGAYMDALKSPPTSYATTIRNVGKARKRWKAMAQAGVAVAFSNVMPGDAMPGSEPGMTGEIPAIADVSSSASASTKED